MVLRHELQNEPASGYVDGLQLYQRQMVNALKRGLLVICFSASTTYAALELTPTIDEFMLDGVKIQQLAFRDGEKKITYQPPRQWDYRGSGDRLVLHPPGKTQAEAVIVRLTIAKPVGFDAEGAKKLVDETTAGLPAGSTNVTVAAPEKNPVNINRKETFLVTIKYQFGGEKYERSILFVNREGEQLRFQLTCREADFEQLNRAFFASHFTWQNL